jgi:LCP family protein required for cell wall assembly
MAEDNPRYRRYRGRPTPGPSPTEDPLRELRDLRRSEAGGGGGSPRAGGTTGGTPPGHGGRARVSPRRALRPSRSLGRRILRWFVIWAFAWVALSALVFLVSAQLHQADVPDGGTILGGGGTPPVGTSTILVIGSDRRPKDSQEPGANTQGYGLADSIMLLRVGGGSVRKLSIARDSIVPIPGHGMGKINSAYAYGGPALLVRTVEGWTGVNVNHVMQISFSDFPGLIDSMGGITYKGSCVISKISGGYKNGGVTLRIRSGERVHLNGKQALALARTRKNACNPNRESDLTRAHRQQKVLSAMKRRALSPIGFVRLPLIAWEAPKTMDSDMAGPRLVGTMLGLVAPGGKTHVLGTPTGDVPDALKQQRVADFLGN